MKGRSSIDRLIEQRAWAAGVARNQKRERVAAERSGASGEQRSLFDDVRERKPR